MTPFDVLLRVQGSAEPGLSVAATTSVLTSARPSSEVSAREVCQVTSVSVCMCVQQPGGWVAKHSACFAHHGRRGTLATSALMPCSEWARCRGLEALMHMLLTSTLRIASLKRHLPSQVPNHSHLHTRGNMHALKPIAWSLMTCMHRALMQSVNIHCSAYRRRCTRRSATLHWHVNWCVLMLAPCRHDASVCRLR